MDYGNYLQFFLTLIFIIGLIFSAAFLAKKLGFSHSPILTGNKNKRIEVKEVRSIDARRKMVLVQCDQKEHLLLIGGSQDLLIDSNACVTSPESVSKNNVS
jgi:flagellar protein FliO/FliZ